MDSPVIVAETGTRSAPAASPADLGRDAKLSRRAKRLGILAAVLCPCHLLLVATVLAVVGFGGAAASIRDNFVAFGVVIAVLAVALLCLAIRSGRVANVCPLPPSPRSQRDAASGT